MLAMMLLCLIDAVNQGHAVMLELSSGMGSRKSHFTDYAAPKLNVCISPAAACMVRMLQQCPWSFADVAKLHISSAVPANEASEPSSADTSRQTSASGQPRRPLKEYTLEKDLQAACDAQDAAEQTQPKLHLVVLGHVDAGKSTLMGRFLHDLG